jgi:Ni/Co efflux regulator RcnB
MKRIVLAIVGSMLFAAPVAHAQVNPDARRVLVIGAHPDDEDNQIIAWLQRGVSMVPLSISRARTTSDFPRVPKRRSSIGRRIRS